jgi:hypothetical protein
VRGIKIKLPSDVWAMLVAAGGLVVLMLGLWAGWAIAGGYYKPEIARLNNKLDAAKEELLASIGETRFWQSTLRGLADGKQLEGVDLKGKPSTGD